MESDKDRLYELLSKAIDKGGTRYITGDVVAMDNATVNIEQHISYVMELQKAITARPEDDRETFGKVAKQTALDIVGEATKDIAKGQIKKAAREIVKLGAELGPVITKTGAIAFFKGIIG